MYLYDFKINQAYRGKGIGEELIKEAQKIVPEISYAPGASEGIVRNGSLTDIQQGDWILCRNLKPLVQAYLWLMKNKIKSKIRGKEIGEGILSLIVKTGAKTISGLEKMLDLERNKLMRKLELKGVRKPSLHPKMEVLQQKIEVINCLSEEVQTVDELKKLIKGIFSDEVKGIIELDDYKVKTYPFTDINFAEIANFKGLENDVIILLDLEDPLCLTKNDTNSLHYVGMSRAKAKLYCFWANSDLT